MGLGIRRRQVGEIMKRIAFYVTKWGLVLACLCAVWSGICCYVESEVWWARARSRRANLPARYQDLLAVADLEEIPLFAPMAVFLCICTYGAVRESRGRAFSASGVIAWSLMAMVLVLVWAMTTLTGGGNRQRIGAEWSKTGGNARGINLSVELGCLRGRPPCALWERACSQGARVVEAAARVG